MKCVWFDLTVVFMERMASINRSVTLASRPVALTERPGEDRFAESRQPASRASVAVSTVRSSHCGGSNCVGDYAPAKTESLSRDSPHRLGPRSLAPPCVRATVVAVAASTATRRRQSAREVRAIVLQTSPIDPASFGLLNCLEKYATLRNRLLANYDCINKLSTRKF